MKKRIYNHIDLIRAPAAREDGWLVVTAVVVITLMLGIGLAIFSTVGTQQSMSRQERNRDSAFNLAESALYSQAFILSRNWPYPDASGNASVAFPASCTQGVTTDGLCPSFNTLQNSLDGQNIPDLKAGGIQWRIQVRDNGSTPSTDYITDPTDPNYTPNQPAFDKNNDNRLWVRADGWSQGKERSLVALLQLESFPEPFPENTITAGHFHVDNNGAKGLISTTGSQVVIRCTPSSSNLPASNINDPCNGYNADKQQVTPDQVISDASTGNAMTPSQLSRFMVAAKAANHYYTSCPPSIPNGVVFIDFQNGFSSNNKCLDPAYTGTATINSQTNPGLIIIRNGILSLGGSITFYGLIYAPNPSNTSADLVMTQGNAHIYGGVAIDGPGGLDVGESQENVTFDANAFHHLVTTGAAGLVQNTWRELPAGTP